MTTVITNQPDPCPAPLARRVGLLFALCSLAAPAMAEEALSSRREQPVGSAATPGRGYMDGGRWRTVLPRAGELVAGWHPVRVLERESGRAFDAWVGADALVALDEPAALAPLLARHRLSLVRPLMPKAGLYLVSDAAGLNDGVDLAARLLAARDPAVIEAIPDLALRVRRHAIDVPPDDPRYRGQWYLERIFAEAAWGLETGAPEVQILVVDNGCDLAHPDLVDKLGPGIDVVSQDDDPSYVPAPTCQTDADCCPGGSGPLASCCTEGGHCRSGNNHGTACAGVIAAATDNSRGIAGVCPGCQLRCARFLADEPVPLSAAVQVFDYALNEGIAVVSNSWGYIDAIAVPTPLKLALERVHDEGRNGLGAVVVFAAGNDARVIRDDELLAVRGVLGVGATTLFDELTSFSNTGSSLDLVAPAGTLTTDISGSDGDSLGDYTDDFGGTSAACPVAAGVAGLVLSADPRLTAAEVNELLVRTTRPAPYATPDDSGHDDAYGHGILDAEAAVKEALGLVDVPDASADAPPTPAPPACRCVALGGATPAAWLLGLIVAWPLLRHRPRGPSGRLSA